MHQLDAPPRREDPFDELLHAHLAPAADTDDEERVARIAEEALASFRALAEVRKAVSLFGSARAGPAERWGDLTRRTSAALVDAGFAVITGGGPGLMEEANAGAAEAGGHSIGLTIQLPGQEDPNPHLSLRVPFHYFFLRKLAFVKYACAFVCVPGGFGTLDELFEALNLKRTHRMDPFPVILVGSEYWMELRDWLEQEAVAAGTLSADDLAALEITDDPRVVVARIQECHDVLCRRPGVHR
ncbi:MAG: TIGR00730 family Rossman fold protein [Gammaproteobacteria bacterium]|nr:TIGR00730 family Rossman fold protein [Gemmatimonadota bacterium]NIU78442.1 TIGR00730 family Rossman fold protein [Gammaproteobacteria bacterium]